MSEENGVKTPEEDGVYTGVPTSDYVAWQVLSSGSPWILRRHTLAALKADIEAGPGDDNTSTARFLGDVVHAAILEPDTFEERYLTLPTPDPKKHKTGDGKESKSPASTSAYKNECAALADENPGKRLVAAAEYEKGIAMRDLVFKHRRAKALLKSPGLVEASFVVTDPVFGLRWKVRPDKLVEKVGANLSVKTAQNVRPDIFTHDFFKWGYHVKEWVYLWALRAAGIDIRHPWMLAIATKGLHEVGLFEIPEVYLDMGEQWAMHHIRFIADAVEADRWPGIGWTPKTGALDEDDALITLHPENYMFDRVAEEIVPL